jgi:hypothetical protein
MDEEAVLKLIETLGDDAKQAFMMYLFCEYGSFFVLLGLVTWGVRALWKKHKDNLDL